MKFCLTCHRLWPPRATYCGHCGRSFGGRICRTKKAHRSPRDAQFCVECGCTDLTDPTPYLSLGCLSYLLTGGGIILLLGWLLPFSGRVAGWLTTSVASRLMHSFNPLLLLDRCLFWLFSMAMLYVLLASFLSLIPGEVGKQLNRLVFGSLGLLLRLLNEGLSIAFRILGKLLQFLFKRSQGHKP